MLLPSVFTLFRVGGFAEEMHFPDMITECKLSGIIRLDSIQPVHRVILGLATYPCSEKRYLKFGVKYGLNI